MTDNSNLFFLKSSLFSCLNKIPSQQKNPTTVIISPKQVSIGEINSSLISQSHAFKEYADVSDDQSVTASEIQINQSLSDMTYCWCPFSKAITLTQEINHPVTTINSDIYASFSQNHWSFKFTADHLNLAASQSPPLTEITTHGIDVEESLMSWRQLDNTDDIPKTSLYIGLNQISSTNDLIKNIKTIRDDPTGALIAAESIRLFLLYYSGKSGDNKNIEWKEKINKNGVVIRTSEIPESTWLAVYGTTTVNAKALVILNYLLDDSKLSTYDDMFDNYEFISDVDNATSIRRLKYKSVWPTAPRDFVVCTTWSKEDSGYLLCSRSAGDEYFPTRSNYVRGNIIVSGYRIREIEGGCEITMIAHTNLGGSLPTSIVNMLSASVPFKMLSSITELLKRS